MNENQKLKKAHHLQQREETSLKKKHHEFVYSISKKKRKNSIQNTRIRNLRLLSSRLNKDQKNQSTSSSDGLDKFHQPNMMLSHLEKVHDSERILDIIRNQADQDIATDKVKSLLGLLSTGDRIQKHRAIIRLRQMLSTSGQQPIQKVIDHNGVVLLMNLAQDTRELHLRLEATWCLANLASGTSKQIEALTNKNVLDLFGGILDDDYPQIVEQAVWGLGNVIGDSYELCLRVRDRGVLSRLLRLFKSHSPALNIVRPVVWCLSNFLVNCFEREEALLNKEIIHTLIYAFYSFEDLQVKRDAVVGISNFCKSPLVPFFAHDSFLRTLSVFHRNLQELTSEPDAPFRYISSVHKILGNLVNLGDRETDQIIEHGFLETLGRLLTANNMLCKKEVCWILSNICAGTSEQIDRIIQEPHLFANLVDLIKTDEEDVQVEALWSICNMTKNGSLRQMEMLIQNNILYFFKHFILEKKSSSNILILILEAIPNFIRVFSSGDPLTFEDNLVVCRMHDSGLVQMIADLQRHESQVVYEKAIHILENYFELEED